MSGHEIRRNSSSYKEVSLILICMMSETFLCFPWYQVC